jgi:hypothetical protein
MLMLMDQFKERLKSMRIRLPAIVTITGVFIALFASAGGSVFASTMTHVSIMETNMDTSGTTALIVEFTAGASDASGTIAVALGSAVSSVATTPNEYTVYNTVSCTTITGASTTLPTTSPSVAGATGTLTVSGVNALTSGTSYCFVIGSTVQTAATNTATPGAYTTTLTDGTDVGTGSIDVISNDQVSVSATVPPSFTMSIANTTDNFSGSLSSGSVGATTGDNITINTNASHGWYLWASDAYTGLHSPSAGATIASTTPGTNATLTAGTAGYVTAIPAANITQGTGSGGTTSATTAYASSGSGNGSGLNATTPAIIASSTGTANAAIVKPLEYAAISGTTPAGADYTDTITYIGAGSF